jgi:hypothetical protein
MEEGAEKMQPSSEVSPYLLLQVLLGTEALLRCATEHRKGFRFPHPDLFQLAEQEHIVNYIYMYTVTRPIRVSAG